MPGSLADELKFNTDDVLKSIVTSPCGMLITGLAFVMVKLADSENDDNPSSLMVPDADQLTAPSSVKVTGCDSEWEAKAPRNVKWKLVPLGSPPATEKSPLTLVLVNSFMPLKLTFSSTVVPSGYEAGLSGSSVIVAPRAWAARKVAPASAALSRAWRVTLYFFTSELM